MKSAFLFCVIALVIFFFSDISHAAEGIEFGYTGKLGPNFWHTLAVEAAICETGTRQSPIDVTNEDLKTLAESPCPQFENIMDATAIHNGNTVEVFSGEEGVPLPANITVQGELYRLQQFHFHTPSEHRINGNHADAEQHLVFASDSGAISVVAVFYDVNKKSSKFMKPIINNLPKEVDETKKVGMVNLKGLLKDIKNISQAYSYSGSLTTPPCTEGVTWYVNQDIQPISVNQFLKLKAVTGFNSRFTQLREDDQIVYETDPNIPTFKKRSTPYSRDFFRK